MYKVKVRWEELGISNDFIFGKIMRNPVLCKELLQAIFPDMEIDRIEYPEEQKNIDVDKDARSVRLDVYVKDGKGTVYNIEMQTVDTKELPKRSRYYQSMIDLQLLEKGEPYRKLNQSFVIFICPFDLFGVGRYVYTFENICREDLEIQLNDGAVKVFLNAQGMKGDIGVNLKGFLDLVAGKETDNSFARKLEGAVQEAKRNREWRHEYMTLAMRDQENIERGMEQGIKQGIQRGIQSMVETLRELSVPEELILQKVQEKFNLTKEDAESYMK